MILPAAVLPLPIVEQFELFGMTLNVFGLLVGMAIVFGVWVAQLRAKQLGLDPDLIGGVGVAGVVPGLIGAHLVSAIFYFPHKIQEDPLYLLKFWDDISSFGGFLGGALGIIVYAKVKKMDLWRYGDVAVFGLTFGWIFGRLGCTLVFDHPGMATDAWFGMEYPWRLKNVVTGAVEPPGTIRHNLGFYEWLWTLGICGVLLATRKRKHFAGWNTAIILMMYTPIRFLLDFLRVHDRVYLGLTPGQWLAIALFGVALWMYRWRKKVGLMQVPVGG